MCRTTCGNLTAVRDRRDRLQGRFLAKASFSALLTVFALGPGCESDSTEPDAPGAKAQTAKGDPEPTSPEPMSEDALADRTELWRDRIAEDPTLATTSRFFEAKKDLARASNEAKDVHLRANASLLLGLLYEARKDVKAAIAQYRHAAKLVPDDAGPHMALALALAADGRFGDAVEAQKEATTLDPDNLENWLVLGELLVKSGDEEAGAAAYVDYERRRKGLINGLTLAKKDGTYLVGTDERVGCAEALASATDQGTANALIYALKSDPESEVRTTVASVMGLQRLSAYQPALVAALPKAQGEVKEAIAWALSEIDRAPVEAKAPQLPPDVVEAGKAAGDADPAPVKAPESP